MIKGAATEVPRNSGQPHRSRVTIADSAGRIRPTDNASVNGAVAMPPPASNCTDSPMSRLSTSTSANSSASAPTGMRSSVGGSGYGPSSDPLSHGTAVVLPEPHHHRPRRSETAVTATFYPTSSAPDRRRGHETVQDRGTALALHTTAEPGRHTRRETTRASRCPIAPRAAAELVHVGLPQRVSCRVTRADKPGSGVPRSLPPPRRSSTSRQGRGSEEADDDENMDGLGGTASDAAV
jgi:hypothetical protein